jgi:hypothetical protein
MGEDRDGDKSEGSANTFADYLGESVMGEGSGKSHMASSIAEVLRLKKGHKNGILKVIFMKNFFTSFATGLFVLCTPLLLVAPVFAETEIFPNATSTMDYSAVSSSPFENVSTTAVVSSSDVTESPTEGSLTEPFIRVGIYKTDKRVQFVSPFPYTVTSDGNDLGVVPENEVVTLTYENGVYALQSQSVLVTSPSYIRLVPGDVSEYFSIMNLDRHLIGRSQMNFNAFRGILEYRYAPKSKLPYVINELLLENYVAGVGETSNGVPPEYIKALQIAARSYAYTMIQPPTDSRMFDVYASTIDQLYLGYNFESFSPNIAFYTAGTRGMMVTYQDKPVTTFYYSRSNGRTKTKKGVPWLKSVVCKYDKGWSQLGHGYGMSNRDAAAHARVDKWNSEKILKYYYSGTEVQKVYD